MSSRFSLRVRLTDGFEFDLSETYSEEWRANRAAAQYISDYRDPCGLGVRVASVATVDAELGR